jgi:hypothetical protein
MNWLPMLSGWQWVVLGAIPPAIIALYFLKLRRQPLEVPSTLLWRKAIEDLHVNSFWQRIRKNLLLYLQLLFMLFVIISLLRPYYDTQIELQENLIILIDNSASMSATDLSKPRLELAKEKAREIISGITSAQKAMIISFNDNARVEQSYTSNRSLLLQAIDGIQPSQHLTNATEALRQAAALANPQRSFDDDATNTKVQAATDPQAEAVKATLYLFSDGRFPAITNFSLGNLTPKFIPIGSSQAQNLGVTNFTIRRKEDKPTELQAFAEIKNSGSQDAKLNTKLLKDGKPWDAEFIEIKAGQSRGVVFDLQELASGALEFQLTEKDHLSVDNQGFALVQEPNPMKILLVTAGNSDLERSLTTSQAKKLAKVTIQNPSYLTQELYQTTAANGGWDLIIYDNCSPTEAPRAHTMYWGQLPPTLWKREAQINTPAILDIDRVHPLSQNLDLDNILIGNAITVTPPVGSTRLVESTKGLLMAVGPRDAFEDIVLGFALLGKNAEGEAAHNTNFHLKPGFPLLMQNMLEYFSRTVDPAESLTLKPGQELVLRLEGIESVEVHSPSGKKETINRSTRNTFHFSGTEEVGIYEIRQNNRVLRRFAVQLADALETNLLPVSEKEGLQIGFSEVQAETGYTTGRSEFWKWLLLIALAFLLLEWYIYNKRVYV